MFLLAGCQASSLDLGVILPRDGEAFLERVECYRLTATRGSDTFEDVGPDVYSLRLRGMPSGRYEVTLEGVEHPIAPAECTGGDVRARAVTRDAWVDPDRSEPVPLVLLPYDRPVALDVPAWVEDWFEGRVDLVGVSAVDADGTPLVVFAGGQIDGRPSAEVLLYEPRRARFSALPDLACARAGAAAVAVGAPGEDEQILFAGGRGACTVLPAPDTPAYEAQETSELFDLNAMTTIVAPLPVPAETPRMLRDTASAEGRGAWLLAQSDEEQKAIDVFWSGTTWSRDPRPDALLPFSGGAFTPIHPDGSPPYLTAGGRADGRLLETLSLFEPLPDQPQLDGCSIATTTAPVAGDHVAAAPSGNREVLFAGNAADGGTRWFRQELEDDPCGARPGYASGPLAVRRETPRATGLGDGRVLLSGGDAEGSLETYLPERGGTLYLGAAGGRRERHAAVVLEDGSVVIAGGGPRTVHALLPRPDAPGFLEWDHNADLDPELDVIVVVSSHEDARDVRAMLATGGFFDLESGFRPGGAGPAGLAEATPPLLQVEFEPDKEIQIVVTTGDLRCSPDVREPDARGDGGSAESCPDPERQDSTARNLTCTLDSIDQEEPCVAQELLGALAQLLANEDQFEPHSDRPLLVLIAAPRDDCSSTSGALFASEQGTLLERCADAEDLIDPTAVARALEQHRDPQLVSVMTFGGPDVVGDPDEACPGIRPTPRLAALSRAMGERGRHIDLCQAGPRRGGARTPTALEAWSEIVEGRIGREVCLPHMPSTTEYSCLVSYEREIAPDVRESVRLPPGEDGWLVEPVEQDPDVPPDAQCSTAILSVSQRLELPIGVPVSYACQ